MVSLAPHTHPKTERVTVISGYFTLAWAKGRRKENAPMPRWNVRPLAHRMKHFVWAKGEPFSNSTGQAWFIKYVIRR